MNRKHLPFSPRKITIFALSLWLIFSSLLTWTYAKQLKSTVQESFSNFVKTEIQIDSKSLPGQFEYECIRTFYYPTVSFQLTSDLPFGLAQYTSINSNDWLYGKWHTLLGYETALGYYDQNFDPLFTQGNYLTFEYTTEENWLSKSIESTGYGYINLDQFPELKELFESTPFGNSALNSFYKAVKLTGTFDGNELILNSFERQDFIDSYHPYDTLDIHQIRELEDKNLIVWEPMMKETESQSSVTVYAYNLYAYRYDYDSFEANEQSITLPQLLRSSMESNSVIEKHSLIESYMTFYTQRSDGIIAAVSVRFWPLQYVMLRMIPYYLLSLCAAVCLIHFLKHRTQRNS